MLGIPLQYVADGAQLRWPQASAGDLDPQHVHAFLALTVATHLQADSGETVRIDLEVAEALQVALVLLDLDQVCEALLECDGPFHVLPDVVNEGWGVTWSGQPLYKKQSIVISFGYKQN